MPNIEMNLFKEEQLDQNKKRIYDLSVSMYRQGYPISLIIESIYREFHCLYKEFTKDNVCDYVWKSLYDFCMKEKNKV